MASLFVTDNALPGIDGYSKALRLQTATATDPSFAAATLQASVNQQPANKPLMPFTPIGIGKPLSVEILTIYTGNFKPKKGLFSTDRSDFLCVSGAKGQETFNAVPRAINILERRVPEKSYLQFSALNACTPYVYYKKAVDSQTIEISVEITRNTFNDSIFNTVSDLLAKAGGLPVFMPASGRLLAGSQLIKILAEGANDLFASPPFLCETITLRFNTAGMPVNTARHVLLCRDEDQAELSAYNVDFISESGSYEMRLLKDGIAYNGNAPYVIVNIDGAENPSLDSWTATAASSNILNRFYGDENKIDLAGKILLDAMSLYNDYTYRLRADGLQKNLDELINQPDAPAYKNYQQLYNACIKNIQNEYLKKA